MLYEIEKPEVGTIERLVWDGMQEMPFFKLTGMAPVKLTKDEIIGKLEIKPEHMNAGGSVHGGMLYTLVDTFAGALAALAAGTGVVTVNSHIEFLRPATAGTIYCKGTLTKFGRNFYRAQGDVFDEEGNLLVTTMNTYYPINK